MNKYEWWQVFYLAFYSRDLYRQVAQNWKGLGYGYLFCLVVLTWVFITGKIYLDVDYRLTNVFDPAFEKFPVVKIVNGSLSMDKPSPYYMVGDPNSSIVVLFDTSGNSPTLQQQGMLFTEKEILWRDASGGEPQSIFSFSASPDGSMGPGDLKNFSKIFRFVVLIGVFLFGVPAGFVTCMIQTLVYALIGKAMAALHGLKLSYEQLIRITVVALTPVLFLDLAFKFLSMDSVWVILSIMVTLGYLYFGISANKDTSVPASESIPADLSSGSAPSRAPLAPPLTEGTAEAPREGT